MVFDTMTLEMPGTQWFNIAQDRAAWCNKIEIK
jgi:hypothetical protein